MAPIRSYSNWNSRPSDTKEKIDPYRKYFIIAEGKNTERWYFERLIDLRKELRIHPLIDVVYCEREDDDEHLSNPRQLLGLAERHRKSGNFDPEHDKMIVIFDADIYEREDARSTGLDSIISEGSIHNILQVLSFFYFCIIPKLMKKILGVMKPILLQIVKCRINVI